MRAILLFLLTLFYKVNSNSISNCFGVPIKAFGGRNQNCFSLCCAEGFVQDLSTGLECVSCDSVGLFQCASCGLYYQSNQQKYAYRCLSANNLIFLTTIGNSPQCILGGQPNRFILNNWTNFDRCSACNVISMNATSCKLEYKCGLTIGSNTGNDCKPIVKILGCILGSIVSDDGTNCDNCSDLIYGCRQCTDKFTCKMCDITLNLTLNTSTSKCVCNPNKTCGLMCQPGEMFNITTNSCVCKTGFTNKSNVCVKTPLCGQNQSYSNYFDQCRCYVGYQMTGNHCVKIVCGVNWQLSPRGICVCKNGYYRDGSQCRYSGGFPARSYSYEVSALQSGSTYSNTTSYKCGCPAGFVYKNMSCVPCTRLGYQCPCPQTTRFSNGTCKPCDSFNLTNCFSCESVYVQQYNQNLSTCTRCLPGFMLERMYQGVYRCIACSIFTNCTQCYDVIDQPVKQSKFCSQCAISNILTDIQNGNCKSCSYFPNCINCDFDMATRQFKSCKTCAAPYVLASNGKSCKCPSSLTNGSCIPCHIGCQECLGSVCLVCRPEFIKDNTNTTCICPDLTLTTNDYCENCKDDLIGFNIQGCSACSTKRTCQTCVSGFLLSDQGTCEKCSRYMVGCISCSNTTNCNSCDTSGNFKLVSGKCVCQTGFIEVNKVCNNCTFLISGCTECSNPTTCTLCNETANTTIQSGKCVCKPNTIYVNSNKCADCQEFMFGCQSCQNSSRCTGCKANFTLNVATGKCVCKSISVLGVQTCAACYKNIPNCLQCNQSGCTKCQTYYDLVDRKCVLDACPVFGCLECDEQRKCVKCKDNSFVLNGACACTPDSGFYINMTNNVCQRCTDYPMCDTCLNSTVCTKCKNLFNFKLVNSTCVCREDHKYYDFQHNRCADCMTGCAVCTSLNYCTVCLDGTEPIAGFCHP